MAALDVYQFGGILHDLIMRQQLFETEYRLSQENRYRFAHIVATKAPVVEASDVDPDLVFLVRRALDKDWRRRSQLSLNDFENDAMNRRQISLSILGLSGGSLQKTGSNSGVGLHRKVIETANALATGVKARFRSLGVTATHTLENSITDYEQTILFRWNTPEAKDIKLFARLIGAQDEITRYDSELLLNVTVEGEERIVRMALPTKDENEDIYEELVGMAVEGVGQLSANMMSSNFSDNDA